MQEERTCCQRHFSQRAARELVPRGGVAPLRAWRSLSDLEFGRRDVGTFAWGNLASGVMFMVGRLLRERELPGDDGPGARRP